MKTVNIGIVGTGWWAGVHAGEYAKNPNAKVIAVSGTSLAKARDFAGANGINHAYESFEHMLEAEGDNLDAIAIVTPDHTHATYAISALRAGKHVLCEKPLAFTVEEAEQMAAEAAANSKCVNMVNFSYRASAAIDKACKMVKNGELGTIYHAEAKYFQNWLLATDQGDWRKERKWLWRVSSAHGSKGALGDIGVHILDFATLPLGPVKDIHCRMKSFEKAPGGRIGEYVLDVNDSALIDMEMESGALLSVQLTRLASGRPNKVALCIYGEKAAIDIDLDRGWNSIQISRIDGSRKQQPWETVELEPTSSIYDRFVSAVIEGNPNAEPSFARGLEIQRILDACEKSDESKHM